MAEGLHMPEGQRPRQQIGIAFYGFILIGLSGGSWGVILPSLITYYGVDKATIGLIFFGSALGYLISASISGLLLARLGMARFLVVGAGIFLVGMVLLALGPPFALVMVTRVLQGAGVGIIETGLNNYISRLPRNTTLMNYLHAFFGVGSLVGPIVASAILVREWPWNSVPTLWSGLVLLLILGFGLGYRSERESKPGAREGNEAASRTRGTLFR
ncbi:MAG: MFS transporter, partial [Ktedonobacteraceae bacterium]|nr:MFS transporter [Ktedonobacteraceae bacterium]